MANEITVAASLSYTNTPLGIPTQTLAASYQATIAGKNYQSGTMAVPTTAGGTAIPLGSLATLGLAIFKNLDASNYVTLLTAAGGTQIIRIPAGQSAGPFIFDPALTAPAALAHTAVVLLEYEWLEL